MSLLTELQAKSKELHAIAAQYGASNLRVFGSVARGEERPESDIDMLADFEEKRSYFDLVELQDIFSKNLNRTIDLHTDDEISIHLQKYISDDITNI